MRSGETGERPGYDGFGVHGIRVRNRSDASELEAMGDRIIALVEELRTIEEELAELQREAAARPPRRHRGPGTGRGDREGR